MRGARDKVTMGQSRASADLSLDGDQAKKLAKIVESSHRTTHPKYV
jgi:hypothetical protein